MKITASEFVKSVADAKNVLNDKPLFVFGGKSNCGKSSLINALVGNKKLARSSSTPGCTQLINYFLINNQFYFVDLPGYGFSKTGKSNSQNFGALVENFFKNNTRIKQFFLLVDIRNGANANDVQMLSYCNYYQIPITVIATKADKVVKSQRPLKRRVLASDLKIGEQNIIICSSEEKIGTEEILNKIEFCLQN